MDKKSQDASGHPQASCNRTLRHLLAIASSPLFSQALPPIPRPLAAYYSLSIVEEHPGSTGDQTRTCKANHLDPKTCNAPESPADSQGTCQPVGQVVEANELSQQGIENERTVHCTGATKAQGWRCIYSSELASGTLQPEWGEIETSLFSQHVLDNVSRVHLSIQVVDKEQWGCDHDDVAELLRPTAGDRWAACCQDEGRDSLETSTSSSSGPSHNASFVSHGDPSPRADSAENPASTSSREDKWEQAKRRRRKETELVSVLIDLNHLIFLDKDPFTSGNSLPVNTVFLRLLDGWYALDGGEAGVGGSGVFQSQKRITLDELQGALERIGRLRQQLSAARAKKDSLSSAVEHQIALRAQLQTRLEAQEALQRRVEDVKPAVTDTWQEMEGLKKETVEKEAEVSAKEKALLRAAKGLRSARKRLEEAEQILHSEAGEGHLVRLSRSLYFRRQRMIRQVAAIYPPLALCAARPTSPSPSMLRSASLSAIPSASGHSKPITLMSAKSAAKPMLTSAEPGGQSAELMSARSSKAEALMSARPSRADVLNSGRAGKLTSAKSEVLVPRCPCEGAPSANGIFAALAALQMLGSGRGRAQVLSDGTDSERVSTGLGAVAHVVALVASYLDVPLRYPLKLGASRSYIRDDFPPAVCTGVPSNEGGAVGGVEFPLFPEGTDETRFAYAVFLLNKDIEQILTAYDLAPVGPRHTLLNLHRLLAAVGLAT